MIKQTLHSETFNLFQLRLALLAAEKDTPARPPQTSRNADELLAQALIERIKYAPRQSESFPGLEIEPPQPVSSPSLLEMESAYA